MTWLFDEFFVTVRSLWDGVLQVGAKITPRQEKHPTFSSFEQWDTYSAFLLNRNERRVFPFCNHIF
jgi:hypothetical protein